MKKRIIATLALVILVSSAVFGYVHFLRESRQLEDIEQFHASLRKKIEEFPYTTGVVLKVMKWKKDEPLFVPLQEMDFYHNKDRKFIAASVIKLPVMLACFRKVRDGELILADTHVFEERMRTGGSGELKNQKAGIKLSLKELVHLMIARSDNTASNMVIEITGDAYINEFFKKEGYEETVLNRRIMDFYARKRGRENYTSCSDTEKMLTEIYRNYMGNDYAYIVMLRFLLAQKVNDRLPKKLPSDVPVAHKTGLERGVVHDAGIIFSPNADYILCVFTQGSKNYKKAKEFIADISKLVYDYLNPS